MFLEQASTATSFSTADEGIGMLQPRKRNGCFRKESTHLKNCSDSSTTNRRLQESETSEVSYKLDLQSDIPFDFSFGGSLRLVDFDFFRRQLDKCSFCQKRLSIFDICGETLRGLGSILKVKCASCTEICLVKTSRQHIVRRGGGRDAHVFDVNTKAALGK